MPLTRAQAQVLLNVGEMQLYDESRINGLRKLDAKGLQKRVERARNSRDRARDLVQRQKLATRDRTGSKRGQTGLANQRSKQKAEVLADILKRFEDALKTANKVAKAAASQPATQKTATRKTTTVAGKKASSRGAIRVALRRSAESAAPAATTRGSVTRKAAAGTKAADSTAAKKVTRKAAKAVAADVPAKKVAKKTAQKAVKKTATKKTVAKKADAATVSPARQQQKALRATKTLLKEKNARDRAEQPWQALGGTTPAEVPAPGYQSSSAARKSLKLHEAETRMAPIHGSISTRDRRNQGKRDRRGGGEE